MLLSMFVNGSLAFGMNWSPHKFVHFADSP